MFKKIDYAMVMVSDMNRSVQFYQNALGFKLRFQSKDWTEFETEGTTLALHGGSRPESGSIGVKREAPAGTVCLGFSVSDLDETVSTLKSRGVRFVMEPTLRSEEGIKLAVCIDPDGTTISLAEPMKKA
jgi:lactoylglutathione lyase